MNDKKKILCVEDDKDTCEMISLLLKVAGYEVISADTIVQAVEKVIDENIAAYIIDSHLRDGEGIKLCQQIRLIDETNPIIFYTGRSDDDYRRDAKNAGAQAVLVKPMDLDNLITTITSLIAASGTKVDT